MNTTKAVRQAILEDYGADSRVRGLVEDVEALLDQHERRMRSLREDLGPADAADAFSPWARNIRLKVPQQVFRHHLNVEIAILEKERV